MAARPDFFGRSCGCGQQFKPYTLLRWLGEPILLFGEREMERRERLRMIMVKLDSEGQLQKLMESYDEEEAAISAKADDIEEEIEYLFYTKGPKELLDARIDIAKYSTVKATARLERARRKRDDPDEDMDAEIDWALRQAGNLVLDCSENGDDRPLPGCSFSRDGKLLATWFASDSLFSCGSLLKTFEGHLDRLARIAFHPLGKYLGTTSFDKTWRLWDIDSGLELLLQECHQDGSLVASCGLDALACVCDLRTGRSILALEGHVKPVLGVSFSPNGYHLATAHSNLISQVKFEPQEGHYLVTASYDMTAKVWSGRDFMPVKSLPGHEAKVTASDISQDGRYIATVSHDQTINLWDCW
ncbi:hypothetical protein GQ457_17G020740 [Hibiscus cannabinus]